MYTRNEIPFDPRRRKQAFAAARALHKHHGKSYFFATRLLPRELREATWALYAFFRVPDEIVDNTPHETQEELAAVKETLLDWQRRWRDAYYALDAQDPILYASTLTFHQYEIPLLHSEDFLTAMVQDTYQDRYENYDALKQYMWGSAAAVGLIMTHVIGFKDSRALSHAPLLGYAMQLTNFLRDIDEDYQERGRVYMPQDELAEYGVSVDDIANRRFTPQFAKFMRFQIERADSLYDQANQGIPFLEKPGQNAVALASTLYREILRKLEAQDDNPFAGRASTSRAEKIKLIVRALQMKKQMNRKARGAHRNQGAKSFE